MHSWRTDVALPCRAIVAIACFLPAVGASGAVLAQPPGGLTGDPPQTTDRANAAPAPDQAVPVGGGAAPALFQMVLPNGRLLKASEELGFFPMPLINRWRFFDAETDSFDPEKYAQKIWTPDLDRYPGLGTWEKFGIPPAYPVWADLDFEEWDPIFNPEDHPPETVLSRLEDYLGLVATTRELRPSAMVCIHGLVRGPLEGLSGGLVETIVSQCDAISPSMASNFNRGFDGIQGQMNIKRERILACLALKRDHGTKVFPVVSKRYRLLDPDGTVAEDELGRQINLVLPPEIQEQMMEVVLTTELDGLRIDGIILWSKDNRILMADPDESNHAIPDTPTRRDANTSEIAFMEIIVEAIAQHWAP